MHPDVGGFGVVEIEGVDGFFYVFAEVGPGVGLREDCFGQAFGAVAAVGVLGDLEDEFVHISHVRLALGGAGAAHYGPYVYDAVALGYVIAVEGVGALVQVGAVDVDAVAYLGGLLALFPG